METRGFVIENPLPAITKWIKPSTPRRSFLAPEKSVPSRMISIIIPAHNEERYLKKTLEALHRQNYGRYEVIVVANGCTDRTAEVARNRCHRLIVLSQKGLGVSRNLGARIARGELLIFLDADTLLEPMTLRRIATDFTNQHAAGTVRGWPDCERLKYKLIYGLKNLTHRTGLHSGSSGVIICWRKHFIETGGFDEGLEVRENSELMRRLMRFGSYRYVGEVTATTSMRRYDQRGCARIVWLWLKLWVQSQFGDLHQRRYETVR